MASTRTTKKRGCKWCDAPFTSLIKEDKEVRVHEGRKVVKPPKGYKYMAKIVTCQECGNMNRFYGPKLVLEK